MSYSQRPPPGYYSQHGEDVLLEQIFSGRKGVCVEVGANNGIDLSNSFHFEQLGWECILIEPDPTLCSQIRIHRAKSKLFECAAAEAAGELTLYVAEGADGLSTVSTDESIHSRIRKSARSVRPVKVAARTLDDMLTEISPEHIDFISIDVEGFEMNVLSGFSVSRWKPRILIIEDNSILENNTIPLWLRRFGYVPFNFTVCNLWFARQDDHELVNWNSRGRLKFLRMRKRISPFLPEGVRARLRPVRVALGL